MGGQGREESAICETPDLSYDYGGGEERAKDIKWDIYFCNIKNAHSSFVALHQKIILHQVLFLEQCVANEGWTAEYGN